MSDDLYYPTTVFGVLLKEEDGWFVYQWPKTYEAVVEELKGNQDVLEVRKITQGASRRRDADGNPAVDNDMSEFMAFEFGWAYDPYSSRFRAPGELLKQPPDDPRMANECMIEISKPEAGWADLKIRLDEDEASVMCSYVYDPFIEMVEWLEMISQGQSSRILINEEGRHTGISAYPIYDSHVRVVIHRYLDDLTVPINHIIDKKIFINKLYQELLKLTSDDSLLYKEWAWDWEEDEKQYPSLKSKTIDVYLTSLND
jgi:hypothetical protein